jgi:hypothetical protein
MANKNVFVCPTCGHISKEHKHGLNKTLIAGLRALYSTGGTSRLDKMKLDNNTIFNNFQKLQYFGLAMRVGNHNEWSITTAGREFLGAQRKIVRWVITRNGTVIRRSDEIVFIHQVKDCVQYKIEWIANANPGLFD